MRAAISTARAAKTNWADGLLATALQHEIDHLNGVLFIDHISRLKRERVWKKFVKAAKYAGQRAGPSAARRPRTLRDAVRVVFMGRRTSPFPFSPKSSARVTRSAPSIRARRSRPGAAWICGLRPSIARPTQFGIPVFTPKSLRNAEAQAEFSGRRLRRRRRLRADPAESRSGSARLGCFNLHASLLPRWRAAPIQRAIAWRATPRPA